MLRAIAAFELRYQLKSPVFWVGALIFFLLTFGSVTVDQIQIGSRGNVNVNSPFAILQVMAIMTLFATFVIVALVANVVLRDDETGFAPIIRSTRVRKFDYLVGRYIGATAAALCVLAVMPLGILIGSAMPWLDAEKVGPLRLWDYGYALFFFALPTLLIASAIYFSLATATRSLMWTYVGAVALLVGYLVLRGLLRDPQFDQWVALADPFGLATIEVVTKYWTAAERNAQLPVIAGVLLANRAIWIAVGLALFGAAYARFSMTPREPRRRLRKRLGDVADSAPPALARMRSAAVPMSSRCSRAGSRRGDWHASIWLSFSRARPSSCCSASGY